VDLGRHRHHDARPARIHLSATAHLFHTAPIAASDWLPIIAVGLMIYLVMELEKAYRRRSKVLSRSARTVR